MAGVEFHKFKKGSIGDAGHYAHYDNAVRADPRIEHSNVHIDITKTCQNYYIGTSGWDETRRRIEARMERADLEHPPQRVVKNRVGFYSLNVKCPPELEDTEKEAEFFQKAYELACEMIPSVEGAFVHKDEKHEYPDSDTGEMVMTRYEMHIIGAAITQGGRLNGKELINPTFCKEINNKMQAMCLREFGISYQTGKGRTGRKKRTVEQIESERVIKDITDRVQYANGVLETVQMATAEEQNSLQSVQKELAQAKADAAQAKAEVAEADEAVKQAYKGMSDLHNQTVTEYIKYYKRAYVYVERDPQIGKAFDHAKALSKEVKEEWKKCQSSVTRMMRKYHAERAVSLQNRASEAWEEAKYMAETARAEADAIKFKAEIKKEIDELLNPHVADFKVFCQTFENLDAAKQTKYRAQFDALYNKNKADVQTMHKHLKRVFGTKKALEDDKIREIQSDRKDMNKLTNKMLRDAATVPSGEEDVLSILASDNGSGLGAESAKPSESSAIDNLLDYGDYDDYGR